MNTSDAPDWTLARLPRFSGIDYARLPDDLDALIAQHRERIAAITADPETARWETVVEPMEAMGDELHRFFSPVSHLHNVADDDALREPYNACIERISAWGSELAQHPGLFRCYETIRASGDFERFDAARRAVIEHALRDFRLGGVALPEAAQARVKTLKVELATLGTRFEEHVLDATQAYRLDVDDENRLAGLPESALALARQNAERAGRDGWTLTLDYPCYLPAMTWLDDRTLRRSLYEAFVTRASEQGPNGGEYDNTPIIEQILDKRQALARELGFANYAELSLATKMAPSTDEVLRFLGELADKAKPAAEHEVAELRAFARDELGLDALEPWDVAWASEKLKLARYRLSQEEIKPYFPVTRVIEGLFAVAGRLFGLEFEAHDGVETWHSDVRFYAIRDSGGEARGFFYLDLYARERKRSGAWMDDCLTRWQAPGQVQLPVAYLTCNFTPPVTGRPTLLTHDEVITLFHEFGHGLHHMLTRVDRPAVAGINGVPWDAVELPSQFLENWCWEREALDVIAGHHETGEPLPEDLYERLIATKRFQAAMQLVRQLEFALFDFTVHLGLGSGETVQDVLDRVRERVAVIVPPAWNRFQHSFSHVFAGGYAAGYYSYKWAEVLSADAFSLFEERGVFDEQTGRRFLNEILENGGAEDAMVLFERFRGRKPSVEPLLRHAGLAA